MPFALSRYYLLDVFAARPFAGNQLAVFLDADRIEVERMQAIAAELNLAETVFIGRSKGENRFPMRIFTASRELPFAGHPTVGAAHLLVAQGLVDSKTITADTPLVLEVAAGPLEITFEGELARFRVKRPAEVGTSSLGRAAAAELAGLVAEEIAGDPVQASCGLPFHLVPLASKEALSRVTLNMSQWMEHISPSGVEQVYFHVEERDALHTRMFARHGGSFLEDSATGSAAAALAGFLGSEAKSPRNEWSIYQGQDMERPSEIHARASRDDAGAVTVEIAGQAVLIGEGLFYPQE
ncbi:PhzF family phenazine biosynthesis protein [Halomonas huangheensis]|uniref:Phenazine biosynthesis protein PhzF n=1 Tax=Halomonas huangheensis TaxID=1178482 RepID=W1NCQ1_9GAMM|nr:PhzF family phenazine biosynthesis protein [Halomonas huangheensis]ALM50924.1 diaminopimelate epimerase [Halomonas huangheensis]ERL53322.1 hypothetical protein BJB45_21025 [Halomonas huangheensis]